MRVTQTGFLQHLHFGGKISESDLAALSALAESSAPQADDLNQDMKFNEMQSEYGFYAHGDFHDPTRFSSAATVRRCRGFATFLPK